MIKYYRQTPNGINNIRWKYPYVKFDRITGQSTVLDSNYLFVQKGAWNCRDIDVEETNGNIQSFNPPEINEVFVLDNES